MNIQEIDALRGHPFFPLAHTLNDMPKLYEGDGIPLENKIVWLHYFVGRCDWWLFEADWDEQIGFGFVCLGDPINSEMGYVSFEELGTLAMTDPHLPGHIITVERDLDWQPIPFREVSHHCLAVPS